MPNNPQAGILADRVGNAALVDAFCHVLGNTCRISRLAASFRWNASGPGAPLSEMCFREQAEELHSALDTIAIHIRMLGGAAILDYSDATVEAIPNDPSAMFSLKTMHERLYASHTAACLSIETGIDLAEECGERASLRLLCHRLESHRHHAWRTLMCFDGLEGHDTAASDKPSQVVFRSGRD